VLPSCFGNHREAIDVEKMAGAKLCVLPRRAQGSAVKIAHHHQDPKLPARFDRLVHSRHKGS
jgi:hypothetical protein